MVEFKITLSYEILENVLIMMIKMMLIVFLINLLIHIYRSFILAVMKELLLRRG